MKSQNYNITLCGEVLYSQALYWACCIIVSVIIVGVNSIEVQNGKVQNETNKLVLSNLANVTIWIWYGLDLQYYIL